MSFQLQGTKKLLKKTVRYDDVLCGHRWQRWVTICHRFCRRVCRRVRRRVCRRFCSRVCRRVCSRFWLEQILSQSLLHCLSQSQSQSLSQILSQSLSQPQSAESVTHFIAGNDSNLSPSVTLVARWILANSIQTKVKPTFKENFLANVSLSSVRTKLVLV